MKERYNWMIENEQRLELHIHLSLIAGNMSYKEQDKLFKEASEKLFTGDAFSKNRPYSSDKGAFKKFGESHCF